MFIYRCFQIIVLWAVRREARQPFKKRTVKKLRKMREELTIKQLAEAMIGAAVSCDASTNTLNIQLDGWSVTVIVKRLKGTPFLNE